MAKKITLKNKAGEVLCPHTAIEQVQGLKEALDGKLGKTEKAVSAKATKVSKSSEADPNFALSFYAGTAETSTTPTADKVYVGSRVDPNIISVPKLDGSTSMANYMNLRMSFNSRYFHEIAALPNYDGIYHRMVYDGNALEWKQLAYKSDVDSKLGKTEKAASATKLSTSTYVGEDLNTFNFTDGSVRYYGVIPPTASNMPDAKGWQNSVMCFGLNENGATAQMFFAKDKPLYYRSSQTGEWQQIAYKSDVDKAFNYLGYNLDLNEFYDNENKSGIVYVHIHDGVENTINAPERQGSAVNFGAGASNFQLFSQANSNKLYHRNRWWSDGGGKWTDWKQLRTIDDKVTTSHIADAAITPAKIQTSIALNGTPSMTVEPTTSSPDKTIASVGLVKKIVDNVQIGGRNLVLNSSTPISSTAYFIGNLPLYENLIENSMYTITIWGELGADRTSFYLYPEWGMGGALCELQQVSNGVYNATFIYHKGNATNSNAVGLYQMPSAGTSTSAIERVKIERGNKATDWSPAPEDVQVQIDGKLSLTGGVLTGSITAPTYVGATDKSGVYSEAIMSYTSAFANNDLNSERFLKAGMYRLDRVNDTINQPGGRGYGHLMTIRGGNSDNAAQMFFDYFDNGNAYIRTGSTNPNAGDFYILNRAWKQLLEDQVTTSHIAEKSINGSKIVSNVDLTGTPMMGVEPTLSSPDRTIASVGLVKKAVDGIEIGGVNLILNSDFSQGTEYWSIWKHGVGSFTVEDKIATFFFGATSGQGLLQTSLIYIESGQQYTMSFNVRSDNVSSINSCYLMSMEGVSNIRLTNIDGINSSWQRIEYHFTASQTGNYYFGLGLSNFPGGSFQIKRVKIEKGNKATDWSPAPEDVEAKIEAVKPTIFLQTLQPSATEVKEGDIWIIQ